MLAQRIDLAGLIDSRLHLARHGANSGAKALSVIGAMLAGGDSIDDVAVLRASAAGSSFDAGALHGRVVAAGAHVVRRPSARRGQPRAPRAAVGSRRRTGRPDRAADDRSGLHHRRGARPASRAWRSATPRSAATTWSSPGPDLQQATAATLRRKVFTMPGRLVHSGRQRHLRLPASWPWADPVLLASTRITAIPLRCWTTTPPRRPGPRRSRRTADSCTPRLDEGAALLPPAQLVPDIKITGGSG